MDSLEHQEMTVDLEEMQHIALAHLGVEVETSEEVAEAVLVAAAAADTMRTVQPVAVTTPVVIMEVAVPSTERYFVASSRSALSAGSSLRRLKCTLHIRSNKICNEIVLFTNLHCLLA
ncbi:unnamed protein product [Cylicostephanus goldi]|uniref:Uncharacterized protein n=1 Tax=Cylicostephanus goldi TaxID=71465 RepID=A0A3P7N600_CYLGO|nr:unnamed protein product [Cylicostephanus goldi]